MRGYRLAFATVIVVLFGWSGVARAAFSFAPPTLATPVTALNVESGPASGTLTNSQNGNNKVDIVVGSCSGTGAGVFTFTPGTTISFNNTVVISVTYTPSALGTRSCGVSVFNMGETTGALATFTVTGDARNPAAIATTTPMPFAPVRVFDGAVAPHLSTRTITVTNTGDRLLTISNVTLTGDFSIDPGSAVFTSTTINGGAAKTWTLRFNPSALGPRTGGITFTSDASNGIMTTVALSGDGTSGSFAFTPPELDFQIVASGNAATLDITLTHNGGNPKGELRFATATVSSAAAGWFAITGQPSTIYAPNSSVTQTTVTVRCTPPANATQMVTGTVTITSDADGAPAPTTLLVKCQGGSAALALDMGSQLMFAPTLVGSTSPTKTITLSNSGSSAATVQFAPNGANAGRFTVFGPGGCGNGTNCSVPVAGSIPIVVEFSPLAESTVSASFGVSSGGPAVGFSVEGRGIDRHINLPESVQFADTFRNPGMKATVNPISVVNSGEYPIIVSGFDMGGDAAVWSVDESMTTLPLMIPGLESRDVMVRFTPTDYGKATDGQLMIVNDDMKVAAGRPIVVLSGNGKERNVDLNPAAIDVGETFAGVPVRLSISRPGEELLSVVNREEPDGDKNTFLISEVRVEGAGDAPEMFEVQDLSGGALAGTMLEAGQTVSLDVVFKPSYVGEFEATLVLYLDEDKVFAKSIPVRGRALFADAHGSGGFGCSTGRGSQGAMALLVAALALVLRRRRR